jgi:hypothetical protein
LGCRLLKWNDRPVFRNRQYRPIAGFIAAEDCKDYKCADKKCKELLHKK